MATDFGNMSAKRSKLSLPEPLNPTEKDQRQRSPTTKHALMNGNISDFGNIGRKSRTHSPKSASNSPKLSPHSSKNNSPKGGTSSPKGGVGSPKIVIHSPKNSGSSPKGSAHSPKGGGLSPKGGGLSPKGIGLSPKSGGISPKGVGLSPKSGGLSPKSGGLSPKNGGLSPKNGGLSPKDISHSIKGGGNSPKSSASSPKGSVKNSKSGSPPSPRVSQLSPKSGQQSRSQSPKPKGRPQSPKGSTGQGQTKLKKLIDNNNLGGIYNTLHVDVDLANNKLTVSPVDGRRCHSDSGLSVKRTAPSISPSESKKRKLEFTEIKGKRSSPPGKKRKADSTGNSGSSTPTKQVDRTVDYNQNIQVVGIGRGQRRNSWDNGLHSPDQYKSIHSIGSRKAVMKVATYSDTILTSTRRSLPACQPSITNGALDKSSGVQVAALDLSMGSMKDSSSLGCQAKETSAVSKPQRTAMVSSKPVIVVTGESETSSIESDPADKYEKVDTDILFKKEAIAKNAMIESEHMDNEINSTADKERSSSTPSSEVFEDAIDKDKRSLTPPSDGDDSAFSTDDIPSTEGKEKQQSKEKQPKRVAKKYADLQPRAPRKRRMASLTAETKNLLLLEKDISPSSALKKAANGGERGRKRKRSESQPGDSNVSDGALLQTCNDVINKGTTVAVEQQVNKNTVSSKCDATVSTTPIVVATVANAKTKFLHKDVKTGRTQSGKLKSPTSTAPKSTGNSKAKSTVSFAVAKKKKHLKSTSSKPSSTVVSKPSSTVIRKPSSTVISKPSSTVVNKPSSAEASKPSSSVISTSPSKSMTAVISSSPSKSAKLLLSRHSTVDSASLGTVTSSTCTSITTPLLLRMSRHSTDGTSSGEESLLPSPSGFDPVSISLLQTGGILTGNFNGQSASSNHYIPKSRVVKKIIKPPNLKSKIGKRHATNGWKAMGEPVAKPIILLNETIREVRLCYQSIKRKEDVIQVRDCVMLRAGVKRKDMPFVAKVAALWEDPESGEIMMSLLWYYRPEHTEGGRRPYHIENELFACRHWDINSVACIEDKCYVLTPAEYNRYCTILQMKREKYVRGIPVVPEDPSGYPRQHRLPRDRIDPDSVFLCRQVYDFRQKRVLKNPY
ncbi:uncharacterized protein [Amphiura filiformis]|uniref:uncharacterized protein isoform X2 n=1 Tax=Amphiura filiformis TaxID=82378 RepID=UPI003B224B40